MDDPLHSKEELEKTAHEAAAWVMRMDRNLTPAEQDDFLQWLAADRRNGEQLARHRRQWSRLDQLALWRPEHSDQPNPDLLAPPPPRRFRRLIPVLFSVATAAGIAIAWMLWNPAVPDSNPRLMAPTQASDEGQRRLPDGSIIELNRGAEVTVRFTEGERRVRLERGEAHFTVAKNPSRPFVVAVRGVDVRAIGTAFNVRLDAAAVEVLVTEGRVQLSSVPEPAAGPKAQLESGREQPLVSSLEVNQRAVVSLAPEPEPPQIATLTPKEIERVLAWQQRLLNFTASPLSEIIAEFNRHNAVQLVIIDTELAAIRITATFRSDNVDGFLRLLEAGFDARVERRGESEILLRKAR